MERIFNHQGKKADILRASIRLFAEGGYDSVSVRDIAKAAGVTQAALYKHFAGKEQMSLYLFQEIVGVYCSGIRQIMEQRADALGKLQQVVALTFDLYQAHPEEIRFALLSQHRFWDLVTDDLRPHLLIKSILEQGMEAELIPRDEVYLLITVFTGLLQEPLAQYPYFADVLPELPVLKERIMAKVPKLLGGMEVRR
ncbi:MAG TPA: helix-turn-helix domain-containing protein [Bacillota bacterium]|nr:helix-turn-helix domain-containing protein [Bacillota bacterium]